MTPCIRAARLALIVAACLTHATAARAQTGANVLVVVNSASPASETIGRQYAARRDLARHRFPFSVSKGPVVVRNRLVVSNERR